MMRRHTLKAQDEKSRFWPLKEGRTKLYLCDKQLNRFDSQQSATKNPVEFWVVNPARLESFQRSCRGDAMCHKSREKFGQNKDLG